MTEKLSLAQARAHWWQRQALAGGTGSIAEVIGTSGWLRTLGGADVYIAARARRPGMKRRDLDACVERGELRVTPAARGCIYLVPSAHVPELLAINEIEWRKETERNLKKIGKTMKVVETLAPTVLKALAKPATTDALRKQLGKAIPSFGDAGKKVGLSSPLPLALRLLEFTGQIERTLEDGKLDTQRYVWRKLAKKSRAAHKDPDAKVIEAFLGYAGPATLGQLACWSTYAQRDLKAILSHINVEPIAIDGMGEAFLLRDQIKALASAPPPKGIALLALEDNYLINHDGLASVTDPRHHAIKVDIWGGTKPETLGEAQHVISRTIVVDGLIAGFWEVDPAAHGGVWMTFEPPTKALAAELDDRVDDLARFLLDDVANPCAYSLDSVENVQDRAAKVKKLRDGGAKKTKRA